MAVSIPVVLRVFAEVSSESGDREVAFAAGLSAVPACASVLKVAATGSRGSTCIQSKRGWQ